MATNHKRALAWGFGVAGVVMLFLATLDGANVIDIRTCHVHRWGNWHPTILTMTEIGQARECAICDLTEKRK